MKKLILCAMLALSAMNAQAADTGTITCERGDGYTIKPGGIEMNHARFTDFSLSSDGYYRVRMQANNKLYLVPVQHCYLILD